MLGLQALITNLNALVRLALPTTAGLALLAFFWGIAKFVLKAGDEKAKDEGKRLMIWGVIALFVLVSIWGITNFISDNLGLTNSGVIQIQTIQ